MPMPDPMHMLVMKIFVPVCFAMFSPVATCREPATQFTLRQNTLESQQG